MGSRGCRRVSPRGIAEPPSSPTERGVALIVALLLLTVLTVISVSAMSTATLQLVMSRNVSSYGQAFQAAETGIALALSQGSFSVESPGSVPPTPLDGGVASTEAVITYLEATPVPNAAFSLGEGAVGLQAFHFEVLAAGLGPRNATSTHVQGFYVLGPASESEP